jgi:hypothetical protein
MWLTLLGGLALSLTGVYLSWRRIRSDVIVLLRRLRRLIEASRGEKPITS